tara:strand:- start:1326 stop:2528 length:1203 start_codon:yes stop_codon:yes gene_type:complete
MISTNKALSLVSKSVKEIGSEYIYTNNSLGRFLYTSIRAKINSPPFDMSAMDGYAVKLSKADKTKKKIYKIINEVFAGDNVLCQIKDNEAVRIYTGGKLPKGANAIIIQENVKKIDNKTFSCDEKTIFNQYIRKKGKDFKNNKMLLKKGHKINARDIGLLISSGIKKIKVYKKPNVILIATGNELVKTKESLSGSQIYASSLYMLKNLLNIYGANCIKTKILKDDEKVIKKYFSEIKNCDLIISTGGVSVGKKDLIIKSLEFIGFKKKFWKVSIKPGKPILFGFYKNIPLFGLPGNSVSTYVCFIIFVLEAIHSMFKVNNSIRNENKAVLLETILNNSNRETYLRGIYKFINSKIYVSPLKEQDSSLLNNLSISNCLIKIPAIKKTLKKNQSVNIIKIDY